MGLSVSKDRLIKDDWYLETFGMPSSTEQVGQELIAPVFKCRCFVQGTDGEAEASNEMVCELPFGKGLIFFFYEIDRRICI